MLSTQMEMGKASSSNAAAQTIFIILVISTFIFHIDCSCTERITCEPELCKHGICYRTAKSVTIGGEIDSYTMQCKEGFDKYKVFCFRVDSDKKSWLAANEYSEETGILASLFEKEYVNIAAEYLQSQLSDNHFPVWANILLDEVNVLPDDQLACTVLEPTNYTRWKMRDCRSQLYSLRTYAVSNPIPTYDFMCRCHTGYTGNSCDIIDSKNNTREQTNPETLQCPRSTIISVEFAIDGYEVKDTTGLDSFATSTLAILRSECQGKNNCHIQRYHGASNLYNKPPQARLAVRHSCVNAIDMYCPSNSFRIEDDKSVNCILVMHRKVPWDIAKYYCSQKGGNLASFNGGIHYVNFRTIAKRLQPLQTLWTFDELSDNRYDDDQWAMAITNHRYNAPYASVPTEKSMLMPGICVIPPIHRANIMGSTTASTTVYTVPSTVVDTTMKIAVRNAMYSTDTSVYTKKANISLDTKLANTLVDAKMANTLVDVQSTSTSNSMTLNANSIFVSTICHTVWIITLSMN